MLHAKLTPGLRILKLWSLLVLVLLGSASFAADDPPGRVGQLVQAQGTVWLLDGQTGEWTSAPNNRPLTSGDRLTTDRGARAELRVGSTTVRLDGGTDFEFRRLDDDRVDMMLHSGSLALRVRSPEVAAEVEVATAEGRFRPGQPGHYRIDRRDDASLASSWRGELVFDGADSSLRLPAGRRAEFWLQGPQRATHYTWRDAMNDEFSQWVASADLDDDRYANTRHVSTEMTGQEDLSRYGNWSSDAEHGALWVPRDVAADWAPYRYGHWSWIAPWGWTWIDDARWGFAPFHYGRWVHYRGRWCWAPGQPVARPVFAPALVSWVSLPGAPVSVYVGAGPAPRVGWLPLAPGEYYRPGYGASGRYVVELNRPHDRERIPAQPGHPRAVPGSHLNQHVPGAVTIVAGDVFYGRRPVAPAVGPHLHEARGHAGFNVHHQPPAPPVLAAPSVQPNAGMARDRDRERVPMPGVRPLPPVPAQPSAVGPVAAPQGLPPAVVTSTLPAARVPHHLGQGLPANGASVSGPMPGPMAQPVSVTSTVAPTPGNASSPPSAASTNPMPHATVPRNQGSTPAPLNPATSAGPMPPPAAATISGPMPPARPVPVAPVLVVPHQPSTTGRGPAPAAVPSTQATVVVPPAKEKGAPPAGQAAPAKPQREAKPDEDRPRPPAVRNRDIERVNIQ